MTRQTKYIIAVLFFFCAGRSFSQTTQTIYYTTKDGLPSNSVYRTVLDRQGFLWIATENGLAKFDGKNFKTYTTAQGLQDNEITDLFIDSNQTIWVTPFRKNPAYYNSVMDRFENEETDPELKKIELGNANRGSVLEYGGIAFSNNQRNFFIYKDGKVTVYKGLLDIKKGSPERVIEYKPGHYFVVCSDSIRVLDKNGVTKTFRLGTETFSSEYMNHMLFIDSGNQVKKYRITDEGDVTLVQKKEYPFTIRIFCKAGKNLAVTTNNGTTYPVDTSTLDLKEPLLYNIAVRNVLEDNNGSSWISTIDKGLIKIQQKRISSYTINDKKLNDQIAQNFNALLVSDKKIFAGDNYGEVLVYDGVYDIKKIALGNERNMDGTVRRIIELKHGYYVACQTGSFFIDKTTLRITNRFEGQNNSSTKYAMLLNDSVLLLGSHIQVKKYNIEQNRVTGSVVKRVTALGVVPGKKIYIGSNDGLYRWDDNDSLYYFGKRYRALSYRVNTICTTADGLVWVGLGSDSLLVLDNDVLIKSIALGDIIPGNVCKSLYSNKAGEVWLGTNKGLNKIGYQYHDGRLTYINTFFGLSDGLIGEQVNDITINNDTVYVATSGGISYLPANLHLPVADITTFITSVSVDGKDTLVLDSYSLPYDKNNISIDFSGVDLTGYYPLFQYNVNNTGWVKLDKNSIELRLLSGKYNIRIRAIKRDGTPSSQAAEINIYIATPFWQSGIFWFIVVMVLFIASIFFLQKRGRQKQKKAVEKVLTEKKLGELEMQALKAQINPHFVFNCLNSIKGFIYDKDYAQADKYLDKFSDLMRRTIDNSDASIISLKDEIAYLDNYLQLEKLRFDEKFSYTISADKDIDTEKVFVPAMLLQPYVENAIRHGMRFLENKNGKITITVKTEGHFLVCEINDDGIGREKAAELKSRMHIEYQSKGMSISKRRAELYHIRQEIIDKKDAGGNALGTTVIVKIPLDLIP